MRDKSILIAAFAFSLPQALPAQSTSEDSQTLLPKIRVQAAEEEGDGPVDGYRATRSMTGTRTDVPLLVTPMSVQVVSRQVLEDQQALTLGDAIKNVSGVCSRDRRRSCMDASSLAA